MSTEDFQVQDIYKYTRKSYRKHRANNVQNYIECRRDNDFAETQRHDAIASVAEAARCSSCDNDSEGEIANILHKKCPVIALAQQQLQKLLDETDKLLCDNTQCCRSAYDFVNFCKEALLKQNRCLCFLIILIFVSFFLGLLLGAASCGLHLRKFNSPILSCIDNFFITEKYYVQDEKYSIIA